MRLPFPEQGFFPVEVVQQFLSELSYPLAGRHEVPVDVLPALCCGLAGKPLCLAQSEHVLEAGHHLVEFLNHRGVPFDKGEHPRLVGGEPVVVLENSLCPLHCCEHVHEACELGPLRRHKVCPPGVRELPGITFLGDEIPEVPGGRIGVLKAQGEAVADVAVVGYAHLVEHRAQHPAVVVDGVFGQAAPAHDRAHEFTLRVRLAPPAAYGDVLDGDIAVAERVPRMGRGHRQLDVEVLATEADAVIHDQGVRLRRRLPPHGVAVDSQAAFLHPVLDRDM